MHSSFSIFSISNMNFQCDRVDSADSRFKIQYSCPIENLLTNMAAKSRQIKKKRKTIRRGGCNEG